MKVSNRSKSGALCLLWLLAAAVLAGVADSHLEDNQDAKAHNQKTATKNDRSVEEIAQPLLRTTNSGNNLQENAPPAPQQQRHRELILGGVFASIFSVIQTLLSILTFGIIPPPGPGATPAPSPAPTITPTPAPTPGPMIAPTPAPISDPTDAPNRAPSPVPDVCNPEDAFVLFAGHNEAYSLETGFINITWAPAFIGTEEGNSPLIWCGEYTYHIFTSESEDEETFLARVANRTVPELIEMANADPNDDFFLDTTTNLFFDWDFFLPGVNYTILVTANIDELGLYSENREPARLEVALVDPKIKDNFSKVVAVPSEEQSGFTTEVLDSGATILFFGDNLPEELDEIDAGVYFYADAVTTNGSPGLFLCTVKLDPLSLTRPADAPSLVGKEVLACSVEEGDMGDIFDELDANGDLFDSTADLDDEELTDEENAELEEVLITLDDNTLTNLCIGAFPDSENVLDECLDPPSDRDLEHVGNRKLFGRRFRRRARKFFRRVKRALDRKISLSKTITFVNLDEGAKMVCESESGNRATEIGIGFDLSAHARFKIEVKIISGFQSASVNLFGGFGVKGYALLTATLEKRLQPKPKKLVEQNNRRTFFVGPVPIIINIRPNLSAFTEAALVVEADVLISAQFGYDYDFGFSVVKGQGFKRTSKFTQRPIFDREPVFDLRINAAAEMGFTFALDVVFFGLLQVRIVSTEEVSSCSVRFCLHSFTHIKSS